MPAYVPPQLRNGSGGAPATIGDDEPAPSKGGKSGGKGDRDGGKGGYSNDRGDDRGDRGQKAGDRGGGKGGGGKDRSQQNDNRGEDRRFQDDGGTKDWRKRQDGRRNNNGEERTELEVFGEKKAQSTAGIDFDKYDAIPVQISGGNTEDLKGITRFSDAKLTDSLFDNLRRCGYDRPTPVQKHSVPIVTGGRDCMACAQTGSGKTCAFMLPCLESLLRSGPPNYRSGGRPKAMPCALVLAPTRELAVQIHVECLKFAFDTGIQCCIVYGGADMREQRMELDRGCDVLVATPGRLTDMCERGNVSLELIQFFILDEADRMLDMGFEPQVRQIVSSTGMGSKSKHRRQSMMFSATFAREVQAMASDFLQDYVFITVGRVGAASELVAQEVLYAGDLAMKTHALERVVKDKCPVGGLALIFVETKRAADDLEMTLHGEGTNCCCIHGDRTQQERESALHAFKTGECPVMVATDVAARGLDIPNVALVVNFDMPKQIDDYVHRIGRTGRAGRRGTAVAFVNERCGYLVELGDLLKNAKQELPLWFDELVQSRNSSTKYGKRDNKFGGQDLRQLDADGKAKPKPVATPQRGGPAAGPAAGDFGNTGAEDAW